MWWGDVKIGSIFWVNQYASICDNIVWCYVYFLFIRWMELIFGMRPMNRQQLHLKELVIQSKSSRSINQKVNIFSHQTFYHWSPSCSFHMIAFKTCVLQGMISENKYSVPLGEKKHPCCKCLEYLHKTNIVVSATTAPSKWTKFHASSCMLFILEQACTGSGWIYHIAK